MHQRLSTAAIALLAVIVAGAGCSSDNDSTAATASTAAPAVTATPTTTSTASDTAASAPDSSLAGNASRVITTDFGDVTVPVRPQRVVALDYAAAVMADYGLEPVGTTELFEEDYSADTWALLGDIPVIGGWTAVDQLNYEAIADQRPDVIVGLVRANQAENDDLFKRLSPIAPTVLFAADGSQDVLDVTVKIADVVGVGDRAEADREAFVARARQIAADYADQLAAIDLALVNSYDSTEFVVYTDQSWWGPLLDSIGASLVPWAEGVDDNGVWMSFERANELADASIVLYGTVDGEPRDNVAELLDSPLFTTLDVAQHTHGIVNLFPDRYTTALAGLDELVVVLDAERD